ncbi:MAG: PKD domain-containing protein [Patescibacteria group bacterium]
MKKILWFLTFLLLAQPSLAVAGIVFTTEPQTIAPDAVSAKLTISSGEAPGETADLFLVSSSATGEFSSSASDWKPVAKLTWNSNWGNRSFYYRDSIAGNHTLTATLTGRTSGNSWPVTQIIIVSTAAPVTDNSNSNATSTDLSSSITSSSVTNSALSAHAAPPPLSSAAAREPFQVTAGRPRLASVHSPVIFRAEPDGSQPSNIRYDWSFGDGTLMQNKQVTTHSYQFPGEYNVVLNAFGVAEAAVSRTTVLVMPAAVAFGAAAADRVTLTNRSAYELNLGGWRLNQGTANFIFPTDTILSANRNLSISKVQLGFTPAADQSLTLFYPDGEVALTAVGRAAVSVNLSKLSELTEALGRLSAQLMALKNQ